MKRSAEEVNRVRPAGFKEKYFFFIKNLVDVGYVNVVVFVMTLWFDVSGRHLFAAKPIISVIKDN